MVPVYTVLRPDVLYWLFFFFLIDWLDPTLFHKWVNNIRLNVFVCHFGGHVENNMYVIHCFVFWSTQEQFSLLLSFYFLLFDDLKANKLIIINKTQPHVNVQVCCWSISDIFWTEIQRQHLGVKRVVRSKYIFLTARVYKNQSFRDTHINVLRYV